MYIKCAKLYTHSKDKIILAKATAQNVWTKFQMYMCVQICHKNKTEQSTLNQGYDLSITNANLHSSLGTGDLFNWVRMKWL